jgi:hypothetical protein
MYRNSMLVIFVEGLGLETDVETDLEAPEIQVHRPIGNRAS